MEARVQVIGFFNETDHSMKRNVRSLCASLAILLLLTLAASSRAADPTKPLKVFILAGQSNMEGKASVKLLETQLKLPATHDLFAHLQKDGKWVERENVWIKFLDRKGNLTVGYGSPGCIGPELEFGNVVGDHYTQPVLLIKTAWGGRSLYRDFRPPSAGLPDAKVLEQMLNQEKKKNPAATLEKIQAEFGTSYRAMIEEVTNTLASLKENFPQYQDQGYEIAGVVWFQGWNDMINVQYTAEYADNLAHFIRDVRKELKVPNLPFVIGQMGVDGMKAGKNVGIFKDQQAKMETIPEFNGNVIVVHTDQYWDMEADAVYKKGWQKNRAEWDTVGSNYPFHYLGSVKTMCAIGKAFGEAMLTLCPDAKTP
jgi:alpha-galactosidase